MRLRSSNSSGIEKFMVCEKKEQCEHRAQIKSNQQTQADVFNTKKCEKEVHQAHTHNGKVELMGAINFKLFKIKGKLGRTRVRTDRLSRLCNDL